jgi:hypothetical protein
MGVFMFIGNTVRWHFTHFKHCNSVLSNLSAQNVWTVVLFTFSVILLTNSTVYCRCTVHFAQGFLFQDNVMISDILSKKNKCVLFDLNEPIIFASSF